LKNELIINETESGFDLDEVIRKRMKNS